MLAIGQKGLARQDVRIPQRNLPVGDGLPDELFPDVIFQDQVREELILGWSQPQLLPVREPGFVRQIDYRPEAGC